MSLLYKDWLTILVAACFLAALNFFNISIFLYQRIIAVLILVFVLFLRHWWLSTDKSIVENARARWLTLFFAVILVDWIVLVSGGFYSPLLILVHLATLGIGISLGVGASVVYLLSAMGVLIINLAMRPTAVSAFLADPLTVFLYGFSFLVTLPLIQVFVEKFRLQEQVQGLLRDYIKTGEKKEEVILQSISELVIVMNAELKIISVNEAVRRTLQKSNAELIFQPLLKVIRVRGRSGEVASRELLEVDNVIKDRMARFLDGFFLQPRINQPLIKVDIQVRVVERMDTEADLIVLIIKEANLTDTAQQDFYDLQRMLARHDALVRHMKKDLIQAGQKDLARQVDLLNETEHDLLTALELKDHAIDEKLTEEDIAVICQNEVRSGQSFAESLGINLRFDSRHHELRNIKRVDTPRDHYTFHEPPGSGSFSALVDHLWFGLMMQKLIDITLLLNSGSAQRGVAVNIAHDHELIRVEISGVITKIDPEHKDDLLKKYYGELKGKTNLKYGSGLEGYIARTISSQLKIPLEVVLEDEQDKPARIKFVIILTKGVR